MYSCRLVYYSTHRTVIGSFSHFEPAGMIAYLFPSNPFVIMIESHSRYENAQLCQWGKSLIPSLSSDFVPPKGVPPSSLC